MNLDPIKRRLAAITPGPWILAPEKCGPQGQGVYQESSLGPICEVGDPYPRGDNHPQENMEFITSSPTDIAALVAEVERLNGVLVEIDDELKNAERSWPERTKKAWFIVRRALGKCTCPIGNMESTECPKHGLGVGR